MYHETMPLIGTAQAWRDAARRLLQSKVPPCDVLWGDDGAPPELWNTQTLSDNAVTMTVPRSFVALANAVVWHSHPERFALLYRVLWRLQQSPHLLTDRADPDLALLRQLEKNVHRCQHKMKAFVRFRDVGTPGANRRSFAAWFEPTHNTVEPTAPFFARRFGDMDWRIITPDVTASFVDGQLSFGEGQVKPLLPDDASEQLWVTYFRNIFNPARLKVQAMQSEMPKKYWKNMPEAAAIPDLIAKAPARVREMNKAAPTMPPARAQKVQRQLAAFETAWSGSSDQLRRAMTDCTRCALHCNATQTVLGEGPTDAALMIVGEQPGDMEDLVGRPFLGPAGKLLFDIAKQVNIDRNEIYVTNAVKHFKFISKGKRRMHQRPNTSEVQHCKWWLVAEREMVRPKAILAMGATAALALTGDGTNLSKRRGQALHTDDGTPLILTYHPSYILRMPDVKKSMEARKSIQTDLALADRLCRNAR